ncbi:MAG: hypothetical protein FWF12_08495 [Betaproteobacteria bacterium]|nr:hypothetical protein [Betaproteobacteria bacterium]
MFCRRTARKFLKVLASQHTSQVLRHPHGGSRLQETRGKSGVINSGTMLIGIATLPPTGSLGYARSATGARDRSHGRVARNNTAG